MVSTSTQARQPITPVHRHQAIGHPRPTTIITALLQVPNSIKADLPKAIITNHPQAAMVPQVARPRLTVMLPHPRATIVSQQASMLLLEDMVRALNADPLTPLPLLPQPQPQLRLPQKSPACWGSVWEPWVV